MPCDMTKYFDTADEQMDRLFSHEERWEISFQGFYY